MAGTMRAAPFLLVLGIAFFVTLIFRVFPFWNAEEAVADARLALLKKLRAEVDIVYSDYKKFQGDAKIVETAP